MVSKYYMVAVSFMPIAYSEIRNRQVEATIFTDKLPVRLKLVVLFLGYVLSVLVYAALTWGTLLEAISKTEKGAYVESGIAVFYTWPSYWILPVSFCLMALVLIFRVFHVVSEFIDNRIDEEDAHSEMLNITLDHSKD